MPTDTFLSLLQTNNILIPVIQRDYAHGRNDEKSKSVREGFVSSLMDAALGRKEMHLDFIYGKKEGENFIPFDGQQRLTTLFLFYRYVAEKIGDKDTIKKTLAKFRYNTRASAKLFCEALCDNDILHEDKLIPIENRLWFLPDWRYDPTIQGMLVVLNAINDKFVKGNIVDNPSIENLELFIHFKYLPMHELGLDDDAYITMNARFLSLTPWENFKASFQKWAKEHKGVYEELCSLSPREHAPKRIPYGNFDREWLDLFYNDDKTAYDKNMMDMVHFHLYVMSNPKAQDNLSRPDFVPFSDYQEILNEKKEILVPLFRFWNYLCKGKEKGKNHIESVFPIWERREYAENKEKEKKLADIIDPNKGYNKRLAYYALMLYFEDKNEESKDPLKGIGDWMRIVQNILEHANLSNDEQKHMNKLRELRKQFFNGDIINDKMKGDIWSKEIEEESLKYRFLQENIGQANDLYRLEAHPWIHGRLRTYRSSPDGNIKIDLDELNELKKRKEWLDNILKKNLVGEEVTPETIADFRYKIMTIILDSKKGDLTHTVIEVGNSDSSSWVSELKKGTWDAVWAYCDKEIPDITLSNNIENWPEGRLKLLRKILEHKGRRVVLLANYTHTFPHTPYIKQTPGGNVATSYLLNFDHYIPTIKNNEIITGQYDEVKYSRIKEDCYILEAKKGDKNYKYEFEKKDVSPWGSDLCKKMQDLPLSSDEPDSSSNDSAVLS